MNPGTVYEYKKLSFKKKRRKNMCVRMGVSVMALSVEEEKGDSTIRHPRTWDLVRRRLAKRNEVKTVKNVAQHKVCA